MKISICLLLVSITTTGFAQGKQDTVKRKLESAVSVSLNSNGIASIPAFSLGKPAVMASVNLTKGRFSYAPVLA